MVGPAFAGGQLIEQAREFQVVLLTTDELASVVRLHADTPLTLTELRTLFAAVPAAKPVLAEIEAAARDRQRFRTLLKRLLVHIDGFNRQQPGLVLAKPDTLFATVLAGHDPDLAGVTMDEVTRALTLLEVVGVLSRVKDGGYVADTSPAGADQLLRAIATSGRVDKARGAPDVRHSS